MSASATQVVLKDYGSKFRRHPKWNELRRTKERIKRLRKRIDRLTERLSEMRDLFEKLEFRRHELSKEWIDVRYELVMAVRHGNKKAFKRTVRKETTI